MAKRRKFKNKRRISAISFKRKNTYSAYESAYKFFAVTAVCAPISSGVYALLERSLGSIYATAVALLFGAGGVWMGYGIAAVWGFFTSCERIKCDYSYERTDGYFSFGTLIPSIITALLPTALAAFTARRLTAVITSSGTVIYDNTSAFPALVGGALLACLITGIILWFIPYNKVISLGNVLPLGISFIVIALAGGIFFGASTAFLTFAFIFYIFSAMAVINQGYLIKIINESGTGSATEKVRRYNFAAVALAFGCIAVAGFFATAVIVGIVVSFRIVFYSVFKKALNNGGGGGGSSMGGTPSFNVSDKIFGGITGADAEGEAMFYYVVFLLMILAFFVALFLHRRRLGKHFPKPSELINRLFALIVRIISHLSSVFSSKRREETDVALEDYTDEELVMKSGAISSPTAMSGKKGARRLAKRLEECRTEGERLSVCYCAARASYIRKYSILKTGDTPSVTLEKLRGSIAPQEHERLARLTEAFIRRAYAGIEPSSSISIDVKAEAERLIAELSEK